MTATSIQLTFLGHAGIRVDGVDLRMVMDCWLSDRGAFQGSWYQFPSNAHLDHARLLDVDYATLSHEHLDHMDADVLTRLPSHAKLLVHRYPSPNLRNRLDRVGVRNVVELDAWQKFYLNDRGDWVCFIPEQSPMCHDASVLLYAGGASFLHFNDAHLADRQPRVVAVQERSATRIQEYRGVVAHGRLFRDKADPVTTVVEIELLPRIQLHYIAHADPIESVTQVWRWIAVHKQLRMRRKPGQHVSVHVVEVLVGQSRVVHIEQPGVIEMRVTWELVPGTLERAAIRQPAIHDHAKVYAVDSDPRVAEEGELDRGRGHDATASICLRRSTACDASLTITPSARPITRSTWRSPKTDLDGGATSKNPTGSQNSGI